MVPQRSTWRDSATTCYLEGSCYLHLGLN